MEPRAILFDLGNTLVAYYRKEEFAPVLKQAVSNAMSVLQARGIATPCFDAAMQAALLENREAPDFRFSPLLPRLQRIFGLAVADQTGVDAALMLAFMQPIYDTAHVYADTIPVLEVLRRRGIKTAIVSNSPWGSAPEPWRQQLQRLGLLELVDAAVFCGDVGWRKPALPIFRHAAAELQEKPEHCLFVGDDPEWDIQGSAAAGMRPLLLDRAGIHADYGGDRISSLMELLDTLPMVRPHQQTTP